MRCLVFAFCFGLAVASNVFSGIINENEFLPRRQYVYKYTTQIATGLTGVSPQQSGAKFSTSALLEFVDTTDDVHTVRVTFKDVVMFRVNQPGADIQTLPNLKLEDGTSEDARDLTKALGIPFSFTYKNGHIMTVTFAETDPMVNAKRGFLSLFEVNMDKAMVLEEHKAPRGMAEQYTVLERTPTGDCATNYLVTETDTADHKFLSVLKQRDYDRCLDAPISVKSPFFVGEKMEEQEVKTNPLARVGSVDYTIRRGETTNFIIMAAVAEEKIIFAPYYDPKEMEEVKTTVNQTLTLVSTAPLLDDVTSSVPRGAPEKTGQHLRMSLPTAHVDGRDPFTHAPEPIGATLPVFKPEKIVQVLREAGSAVKLTSKSTLLQLRIVTEVLRTAPHATLTAVHEALTRTGTEEDRLARDVMWQALPHVATEAAVHFMLTTCSEVDDVMADTCAEAMGMIAVHHTPCAQDVGHVIEMINKKVFVTPRLRQSLYLTLGTFGFKFTTAKNDALKQLDLADSMLYTLQRDSQKYVRKMVRARKAENSDKKAEIMKVYTEVTKNIAEVFKTLVESPSEEDKVLAIKAIGNSGLRETFPILKTLVLNSPANNSVLRTMAVWALRRMGSTTEGHDLTKSLLTSVFMNHHDSHEVRTAAFVVLMTMQPELPLLERIVETVRHERDLHVASYVLSFMTSFANSTYEPFLVLSNKASKALASAPLYKFDFEHSFYTFAGKYDEKYRMGSSIDLAAIGSMARYFGVATSLTSTNYGTTTTPFEVGMNSMNLNTFINEFMYKGDNIRSSFVTNIMKTLKVKTRDMEAPNGHFYMKHFGHETRFISFTEIAEFIKKRVSDVNSISEIMSFITGQTDLPVAWSAAMFLGHVRMTLPTEAGLPVSLQTQMSTSINLQGKIGFTDDMTLKLDLDKKTVSGIYATMGFDGLSIKPSVGFHGIIKTNFPIKKEINFDVQNMRVEHTCTLAHEPSTPLVQVLVEPFHELLMLEAAVTSPSVVAQYTATPILAAPGRRPRPISMTVPVTPLGWQVRVEGQTPAVTTLLPLPGRPLQGRSLINVFSQPIDPQDFPKVITTVFKVMTGWNQKVKEESHSLFSLWSTPKDTTTPAVGSPRYTIVDLAKSVKAALNHEVPENVSRDALAYALSVDASSPTTDRKMTLEILWNYLNNSLSQERLMKFWRSEITGVYAQPWQMATEFNLTGLATVHEPEDILSEKWIKELYEELSVHLKREPNKVVNQLLNMTVSGLTQQGYSTMEHTSVVGVLNSLMPELVAALPAAPVTGNIWRGYWAGLFPLAQKIEAENLLVVDPYLTQETPRDKTILTLIRELTEIQMRTTGFAYRVKPKHKNQITEAELPIIQWMLMNQAEAVRNLMEATVKSNAIGVNKAVPMESVMDLWKNSLDILTEFETLLITTKFTEKNEPVMKALFYHSQLQVNVIKAMHLVLTKKTNLEENMFVNKDGVLDLKNLQGLVLRLQDHITEFDAHWTKSEILNPKEIHYLTLVTVNNQFMLNMWQTLFNSPMHPHVDRKNRHLAIEVVGLLKKVGSTLAERVAHSVKLNKRHAILKGVLTTEELTMMEDVQTGLKQCIAAQRIFLMEMDNMTTLSYKKLPPVDVTVTNVINTITTQHTLLSEKISALTKTRTAPALNLVTEVFEAIMVLKDLTETTSHSLLPVTHKHKLTWMTTLTTMATDIQTLITKMSPIFEKYTVASSDETKPQVSTPWYGIKWNIHWGTHLENTLNMKIHAVKSVEQLLWLLRQQDAVTRSREVVDAVTGRLSGHVLHTPSVRDALNTYNHIHWGVNATNVPAWLRETAVTTQEMLKFHLYPLYSRSRPQVPVAPRTTDIVFDISELNNKMDLAVMTPTETDMFVDIPLHTRLFNLFKPTQNVRPIVNQFIETVTDGFAPAMCTVNDVTVRTFDTLSFPVSEAVPRGCQAVLAMDCSTDRSFVVTRRAVSNEIEIVFGENVINVAPTAVTVNKKQIALPEGETIVVPGVEAAILRRAGHVTTVTLSNLWKGTNVWQLGATVTVTRHIVTVQVPPVFKHRMCGLCSNFDGQRSWELETPSGDLATSPAMFAQSYVLPHTCPVPELTLPLNPSLNSSLVDVLAEELQEEEEGCYPITITKTRRLKKKNQRCFSQPIQRCSFDCEDYNDERTKVTYHCFPLDEPSTTLLKRRVARGEVLTQKTLDMAPAVRRRKETIETHCH